jgi:hypothetical protein
MTDTVVKMIPMDDNNIVDPSSKRGLMMLNIITGGIAVGRQRNVMPINPTKEHKQNGYHPKMTLKRSSYPMINDDPNSFCCLIIECSLPKIMFENNVEELCCNDFEQVLLKLQRKIYNMGISFEIDTLRNAHLSRVDFSKNIIINAQPRDIINLIGKIGYDRRVGKIHRDYDNGGTSIRFFTKEYHILIYDKIAEIKKSFYSESRSVTCNNHCQRSLISRIINDNIKIIRYEVALKRDKLVEYEIYKLKDIFNTGIPRRIILEFTRKIHDELRTLELDKKDFCFTINRIKTAFPDAGFNRIMSLLSAMNVGTEKGYDYIRSEFEMSSAEFSRLRKDIKQINSVQNLECTSSDIMQSAITTIINTLNEFQSIRLNHNNTES